MTKPIKPLNQLLAALPEVTFQHLRPRLEPFDLEYKKDVYNVGDVFTHVYFVENGIISLLAGVDDHSKLEVGMVGGEGMAALPVFLGVVVSDTRTVVQGAGLAQRMTVADFTEECDRCEGLSHIMRRYTYSIIMQIARSAACNRFHSIDQRMARWLMMTRHLMKSDEFGITQEFLSHMLGVRREAINKAAGNFQHRGLISYTRGHMSITDPIGLAKAACSCFKAILAHQKVN